MTTQPLTNTCGLNEKTHLINENIDGVIISHIKTTEDLIKISLVCKGWRFHAITTFTQLQKKSIEKIIDILKIQFPKLSVPLADFDALVINRNLNISKIRTTATLARTMIAEQLSCDSTFREQTDQLLNDPTSSQELREVLIHGLILSEKPGEVATQAELDTWHGQAVKHSLSSGLFTQAEKYVALIKGTDPKDEAIKLLIEVYLTTNRLSNAKSIYQNVTDLDIKKRAALNIFNAYIKNDDLENAESIEYEAAYLFENRDPYFNHVLAKAYAKKFKFDEFIQKTESIDRAATKISLYTKQLLSLSSEKFAKQFDLSPGQPSQKTNYSYEVESIRATLLEKTLKHIRSLQDKTEQNKQILNLFHSLIRSKLLLQAAFIFDTLPSDHAERALLSDTISEACEKEIEFEVSRSNLARAKQITYHIRDIIRKDRSLSTIFDASLDQNKPHIAEQILPLFADKGTKFKKQKMLESYRAAQPNI